MSEACTGDGQGLDELLFCSLCCLLVAVHYAILIIMCQFIRQQVLLSLGTFQFPVALTSIPNIRRIAFQLSELLPSVSFAILSF